MAESRRITGPHLLLSEPGAAIELTTEDPEAVVALARHGAERLGWTVQTAIRCHAGGATVAISAPPDQLYTACYLLDWAVDQETWEAVVESQTEEENPELVTLLQSGGAVFFDDDDGFTAGMGRYSQTWPLSALPTPGTFEATRIPFVFITGTNGKTTTTRMVTRIAQTAGFTPGWTSSDAWGVGGQTVQTGDWTGPGAARHVLRHPEVDFGCLETARGGLLRRGLVVGGADAAVVTNVSSDHLGEWGVYTVADMAEAKLGVVAGIRPGGVLVANAGNPTLRQAVSQALARRPDVQVWWFADGPVEGVRLSATADAQSLVFGETRVPLTSVPLTYGGTARHNVENALAAGLCALAAGIDVTHIGAGLMALEPSVDASRGRMNTYRLSNGAVAVLDFGHNPAGVRQVGQAVFGWPGERRMVLVGQAGDRTDGDLLDLARVVSELGPDQVVLKEMAHYRRGRQPGEVVSRIMAGLEASSYPKTQVHCADSELEGIEWLLDQARPGDLLLLLVQVDLDAAVEALESRGAAPIRRPFVTQAGSAEGQR